MYTTLASILIHVLIHKWKLCKKSNLNELQVYTVGKSKNNVYSDMCFVGLRFSCQKDTEWAYLKNSYGFSCRWAFSGFARSTGYPVGGQIWVQRVHEIGPWLLNVWKLVSTGFESILFTWMRQMDRHFAGGGDGPCGGLEDGHQETEGVALEGRCGNALLRRMLTLTV